MASPPPPARWQARDLVPSLRALGRRLAPAGAVLWLGGVLVSLAGLLRGAWLVGRLAARTRPVDAASLPWQVFQDLPPTLRHGVALRLTDDLTVPTLAGIWRPQIWFPRVWVDRLTPAELRHVLLHELGHARRRDLLAQTLCSLAACLHWFNPLVFLLGRQARAERELACDAWVLAHAGEETGNRVEPAAYGHTLLKLIGGSNGFPLASATTGLVAMAVNRRSLSLRVREISAFRPLPRWRAGLALGLAALGLALGTVGQASEPETPSPSPAAASSAVSPSPGQASPGSAPDASPSSPDLPSSGTVRGMEFESKFIGLSKEAVQQLRSMPGRDQVPPEFAAQLSAQVDGPLPVDPAGSQIPVRLAPADLQKLIHFLNQQKGVDLLSAPRVTTRDNQKATIEIIREFIYADQWMLDHDATGQPKLTPTHFDRKNPGLTLEVEARFTPPGETILANLAWKIVDFQGFVGTDGQPLPEHPSPTDERLPTFSTQSQAATVTMAPDETVVFACPRRFTTVEGRAGGWDDFATPPGTSSILTGHIPVVDRSRDITGASVVLIFVTVHRAEMAGEPPPTPAPKPLVYNPVLSPILALPFTSPGAFASEPSLENSAPGDTPDPLAHPDYPYGVPVLGKPGFVTSPYAPDAGYVDLTGYERGQEVRDPYTQKIFLVP